MNIHVILNGAELREESRGLKREILRYAQNDKKIVFLFLFGIRSTVFAGGARRFFPPSRVGKNDII